ncbi:uncharacterized protein BDZ99DRAFT_483451 [Mytilinidion resinicola]|uniref:Uncharacterized protein n=1 Tax=Mytilinidion resinicola TaxID=574789 RepID=A0A6A6Y1G8_9PEZI|nr:uncharacterized protein BDZ99DRAFT_483451 [Mytilinidion resinicola]KAF2801657.1 hypothetical protein BDZ99DRAFT_483451 [Mytilinidion resinicola]
MPSLLTIPREIRDEIYTWGLLIPFSPVPPQRIRISTEKVRKVLNLGFTDVTVEEILPRHPSQEDIGYVWSEESVRYPLSAPLPPTHHLLSACSQIRTELKEAIRRMGDGKLRYKIDLALRNDKFVLYPTWVSIPMLSKHVDELEVTLRILHGRTKSVCSVFSVHEEEQEGSLLNGGLACLIRFVERGVHFLSKKKREGFTVGLLVIDVHAPGIARADLDKDMEETAASLEKWMQGTESDALGEMAREMEDTQIRLLARKIESLRLSTYGRIVGEWDMKEMIRMRDELARN